MKLKEVLLGLGLKSSAREYGFDIQGARRVQYLRELQALGYRLHKWESEENYRGQVISERDADKWRHYDVFAVPSAGG